jgi:heme exporter protein B
MKFWQILALLKKDWLIEWKNRSALNGLLLYTLSTVFVCYLALKSRSGAISPTTWNAVFWIIVTFLSLSASVKSFATEAQERNLTYFFLVSPQSIIVSKIIYNSLLVGFVSLFGLAFYALVLGNPVVDLPVFGLVVGLGSMSLAVSMTLTSAIAAQATNSQSLMPILSLPICIPSMLISIKASKNALEGMLYSQTYNFLTGLVALILMLSVLSYVLFPVLWKE